MTRNWPLRIAPSLRMSRAMPEVCVMGYDLSVLGAWHCAQSSIRKQTWGCPMVKNPQHDNASYMYLPHRIGSSDRRPLLASRRRNGSAYRARGALVVENFLVQRSARHVMTTDFLPPLSTILNQSRTFLPGEGATHDRPLKHAPSRCRNRTNSREWQPARPH